MFQLTQEEINQDICQFKDSIKHHHPNVVIFETTRSLHTIRYLRYSIFTFKLVFKEYLTPNVMQITLINQVPYMGMCS